jgi:hypothetical protein
VRAVLDGNAMVFQARYPLESMMRPFPSAPGSSIPAWARGVCPFGFVQRISPPGVPTFVQA